MASPETKGGDVEDVARVVLGVEGHDVAEEVMHFLDRSGRVRVVATATDERQLAEAVRQLEPDAVVASPSLVRDPASLEGRALLAVDTSESVGSLRRALSAGARGFFLWPSDREELAGAAGRILPPADRAGSKRALVVAVYGPRGGAGTTFLATHLASAFARRDRECVLVDLDLFFGDVTSALGVPAEGDQPRTLADALPLVEELTADHLREILWPHPGGFRALLAPGDPEAAVGVGAMDVRAVLGVLTSTVDVAVLHLPRAIDERSRAGLLAARRMLMVLSLDVLSFRAAKRALASLPPGISERCDFVVNRAARGEIGVADVERVFGRAPLAVVNSDGSVAGAQDRGRLLPMKGRTGRAVDRLARRLLEEAA